MLYSCFQKTAITTPPVFAVQFLINPRVLARRPLDFGTGWNSCFGSYGVNRRSERSKRSFLNEDATYGDYLTHALPGTTLA